MIPKEIAELLTELTDGVRKIERESAEMRWQTWRKKLLAAWANDSRSLMTALLEDGP